MDDELKNIETEDDLDFLDGNPEDYDDFDEDELVNGQDDLVNDLVKDEPEQPSEYDMAIHKAKSLIFRLKAWCISIDRWMDMTDEWLRDINGLIRHINESIESVGWVSETAKAKDITMAEQQSSEAGEIIRAILEIGDLLKNTTDDGGNASPVNPRFPALEYLREAKTGLCEDAREMSEPRKGETAWDAYRRLVEDAKIVLDGNPELWTKNPKWHFEIVQGFDARAELQKQRKAKHGRF